MPMPRLRTVELSGCQQKLYRECINHKTLRLKTRCPSKGGVAAYLWCRLVQIFKPDHKVPNGFYTFLYEQDHSRDTIVSLDRMIGSILSCNRLPSEVEERQHVPLVTNFFHD